MTNKSDRQSLALPRSVKRSLSNTITVSQVHRHFSQSKHAGTEIRPLLRRWQISACGDLSRVAYG
jgi:hypothetical protein